MEQVIILILLFMLPGIIRKLTGGKKKAARPPRESKPVQVEEPGPSPENIPAWLRKLSEGLGEVQQQRQRETEPAMVESMDVSSVQEALHGDMVASEQELGGDHRVRPSEHLQEASSGYRVQPGQHLQTVTSDLRGVSDAGTTSVADTHWRGKKRSRMPLKARPGRGGWRRAIILAEILGPPRASRPYRSLVEPEA